MNLPGHPPKPKTEPEAARKREFACYIRSVKRTIRADDILFTSHHVVFMNGSAESKDLFLVSAFPVADITLIEEVEDLL